MSDARSRWSFAYSPLLPGFLGITLVGVVFLIAVPGSLGGIVTSSGGAGGVVGSVVEAYRRPRTPSYVLPILMSGASMLLLGVSGAAF